jgi:hypothetical protein
MHQITDLYQKEGEPIRQYYGKWPFYRFLALQEPASVLFSILNLIAHYYGLLSLRNLSRLAPMRENYTYIALSGIFACNFFTLTRPRDLQHSIPLKGFADYREA